MSFEDIKRIIKKCIDENIDIKDFLDYKTRIIIMRNPNIYFNSVLEKSKIDEILFTEEEAQNLYMLSDKTLREKSIILKISDSDKLNVIKNSLFLNASDVVLSIKSEDIKIEALKIIIKKNSFFNDLSEIICSFNNISKIVELLENFFAENQEIAKNCLEYNIKLSKIYNFAGVDKDLKMRILSLYDKYDAINEFKVFDGIKDKIGLFKEIVSLPNYKKKHYKLYIMIDKLDVDDINIACESLKENGYQLTHLELGHLFIMSKDKRKFIDFIYEDIKEKRNIIIRQLLSYLPRNEIPKYFKEILEFNDKFDMIEVASGFKNEIFFNCMEIAINDYFMSLDTKPKEEIIRYKKVLCINIINFLELLDYDIIFDNNLVSCDTFINYICEFQKLDINNFKKMLKRFGYQIFKYLKNENIIKLINLNPNELEMVLKIFTEENTIIDSQIFDSLTEAVLQREFIYKNVEEYNIFSQFENLIANGNHNLKDKFYEIVKYVSDKNLEKIKKICESTTLEKILEGLIRGEQYALDILHSITDEYIRLKRTEYIKTRKPEVIKQLDLDKKYKKEWIIKKYIQNESKIDISCNIRYNCVNLNEEQTQLINDKEELENIIEFKKNPSKKELLENINKRNLKIFSELLDNLYQHNHLKDKTNDPNAEYIYTVKKVEREKLIEILSQLDIDCIKDKLLTNTEIYQKLLDVVNKNHFIGIGTTFIPIKKDIDLEIGSASIAGLINYYYKIYDKSYSITKLLEEGYTHEMASNKYAIVIGNEDFQYIFANTGRNRSSAPSSSRLEKVLEIIPQMYAKESLSVPPINQIISLSNGKTIKVELGNSTDMTNLSVGERTEACLRALGAFNDLWEFALTNKNGFNIIFKDPETNQFISRVTSIRNGNTIFENELRHSVLKEYDDCDIIEANNIVAQILIKLTNDSNYPIENVIITSDYAMSDYKTKTIKTNRNDALYNLHFNYETKDDFEGIVLSGQLKNISLSNNTELYDIIPPINKYIGASAINKVRQIHAINDLINGISIEDIEIIEYFEDYELDDLICLSNNQFYILKYKNEIIKTFLIDKYKNNQNIANLFESTVIDEGGITDENIRRHN